MKHYKITKPLFAVLMSLSFMLSAQETNEKKADSTKKATKELPLEPERKVSFKTTQGTWLSLDVHPDGKTIIFDMMGDLYTLPITGGKATRIKSGMPYDVHPRYSPD